MATPRGNTYSVASGEAVYAGTEAPDGIAAGRTLSAIASLMSGGASGGSGSGSAAGATLLASASIVAGASTGSSVPTGTIEQYLTSDGGAAASGSTQNFSGPTRLYWHRRLGIPWKRTNTLGNWLDSAQAEEGSSPYGSSAPLTAVDQVASVTVTALVARWLSTGHNRGAYLRNRTSTSAFPVRFYGRTDATSGNRPTLTVVTSAGTFVLTAAANATWNTSTVTGSVSALQWDLVAASQPAILRFDLSSVTGTLTSATLTFKVKSFPSGGSTGQIVDVFEADPPTIIVPENVASPELGLYAEAANFQALASHPDVLFSDDFESPGPFDSGFVPAATRTLNTDTNTTYARGTIAAGANGSADNNKSVSQGTGTRGVPNVVYPELFGQYHMYLEPTFGTTQNDAIKIPAMGVQFGYWNPAAGGYWQSTTGNGGSPGTGLKVDPGGSGNFIYEGHSVRFITGTAPAAGDDDPYSGYFGIAIYPYNLDQIGAFPAGESFPNIAIRLGQWYCFDIRVKQNSMSGGQDGLGNYATANADGIFEVWINGYKAYSRTNYRWRRHEEFGVQGLWVDVYHGGVTTAPQDMHYRLDRVTIAESYIGPPLDIPDWVASIPHGEVATYSGGGAVLTNNFRSQVSGLYDQFYSVKIVNDYCGAVANQWLGDYGAKIFGPGAGHSASNDNSVIGLEYSKTTMAFRRLCDPSPWAWSGAGDRDTSNESASTTHSDLAWGEYKVDGKPWSVHSYGLPCVQGPDAGGASCGTLWLPAKTGALMGALYTQAAHKLPLLSSTAGSDETAWQRASATTASISGAPVALAALVPAQQRIYLSYHNDADGVLRWLDLATGDYVIGSGTGFDIAQHVVSGGDCYATKVAVPERDLLLLIGRNTSTGALVIQWMDVSAGVTQPTLGGTATLSTALTMETPWSSATWCPDNNRLLVIGVAGDLGAVQEIEIPATLTDTWTVTRAPLGAGQTLSNTMASSLVANVFGKWSYDRRARAVVFFPIARRTDQGADQVYVYRPRNT
jgi:hypothetical protein